MGSCTRQNAHLTCLGGALAAFPHRSRTHQLYVWNHALRNRRTSGSALVKWQNLRFCHFVLLEVKHGAPRPLSNRNRLLTLTVGPQRDWLSQFSTTRLGTKNSYETNSPTACSTILCSINQLTPLRETTAGGAKSDTTMSKAYKLGGYDRIVGLSSLQQTHCSIKQ